MNGIVSYVRKNINNQYLVNLLIRIAHVKNNKQYREVVLKLTEHDTILNVKDFFEEICAFKQDIEKGEIRPHYLGCENAAYGYYSSIQEYAKYKCKALGVNMEHGVDFSEPEVPPLILEENEAFFYQEKYKDNMIHKDKPYGLSFNVGPYIHYATSYYDDTKLKEIKKEWGKTVLIYISHSTHESKIERKYGLYARYYARYKDEYDKVLFCVYWRDLTQDILDTVGMFHKAAVVSAGFIYDQDFVRKTKSLLLLSDLVVTDEIGTSVGYALYLNKEVEFIKTKDIRINNLAGKELDRDLHNKYLIEKAIVEKDYNELKRLYDYFWSPDMVRTCDEMRLILEGLDEISLEAKFNKKRYKMAIEKLLKKWKLNDNDKKKRELFLSALGDR